MKNFVFEKIVNNLLLEGVESKNMKLAKHYLYDNFKYDEQMAMKVIGSIKTDIPNVRNAKCKFILGITRMYMTNQLKDAESILGINKTLKYVTSDAHVNEYDNNLNNISAQDLITRFSSIAKADVETEKERLSSLQYNKSDYNIVKINDFDDATNYSEYVTWCVTQDEDMYNSYTHNGFGVFYFCLKNGFENVEEVVGENTPLDEYGLSMIAVSVNDDGSCNTITCRWNHENGGNDSIMTPEELSNIIGYNFYDVFKPISQEELLERQKNIIKNIYDEVELAYCDISDILYNDKIEICYDSDYDEYFDGEYYDPYGDLRNTEYDDGEGYKEIHACGVIISSEICYDEDDFDGNKYIIVRYPSSGDFEHDVISLKLYDYVAWSSSNCTFLVRSNKKTNLLNLQGKKLIGEDVKDICTYYNKSKICGIQMMDEKWYLYDLNKGKPIINQPFLQINGLGSRWVKRKYEDPYDVKIYKMMFNDYTSNLYYLETNTFLLNRNYNEIRIYDNIIACSTNKNYYTVLYTIDDENNVRQITDDDSLIKLTGFSSMNNRSDYGYTFYFYTDKYFLSFDTFKIHKIMDNYTISDEGVDYLSKEKYENIENVRRQFNNIYEKILKK